jgi:hypothetical protein
MATRMSVGSWNIDIGVTQLTTVMEAFLSSDFWMVLRGFGKRHFLSSEPWILWAAEASLPSNIAPLPVSGAKNLVDSMREMPRVESAMLRR